MFNVLIHFDKNIKTTMLEIKNYGCKRQIVASTCIANSFNFSAESYDRKIANSFFNDLVFSYIVSYSASFSCFIESTCSNKLFATTNPCNTCCFHY
ncbi:hypothetical protein BpHYR1_012003 [Brachionus plicatilis]|uniref:Uncharacterized protein n=1 Tax=Brachionus plicatilis TaxID=10195 RepID=A0A3M7PXG0_BRAPC|nr:hypothetical protein BpHYR1_012003 [Brachionus plicatilis]